MILNISTTHFPATNLSFLLHKHPSKVQSFNLSIGKAYIFYPEYNENRTTVSLLLDIDTIEMVRGKRSLNSNNFALANYVNDRPYVASSFMSVAIAKTMSSALNGNCKDKPELVDIEMPFEIELPSIPAPKGGENIIRSFFEPLGYHIEIKKHKLDSKFDWGFSRYYSLKLKNTLKLKTLLSHLYVLIPALDNDKHYFISHDEIDKLLNKGEGWLQNHPEKNNIVNRYLIHLKFLSKKAIEKLSISDEENTSESEISPILAKEKQSLHDKRLKIVCDKLLESKASTVIDLGCGEGKLIRLLLKQKQFHKITGMDVSYNELLKAKERLHYEDMPEKQKDKLTFFQGSLTYKDKRIENYEAAAVVEVIEHLDLNRLKAFERVLFEFSKIQTIILTTPNKEYNVKWEKLDADTMRHSDHRFEWTRTEFANWANNISKIYNYSVKILPIGDEEENIGAPSQMAIFTYGN